MTPLTAATVFGYTPIVKILVETDGIKVNRQTRRAQVFPFFASSVALSLAANEVRQVLFHARVHTRFHSSFCVSPPRDVLFLFLLVFEGSPRFGENCSNGGAFLLSKRQASKSLVHLNSSICLVVVVG